MVSAVIFDLDGTVLDNEGVWESVFREVVENHNFQFSIFNFQTNKWMHEPGLGIASNWRNILVGSPDTGMLSIDDLTRETWKAFQERFTNQDPQFKIREGIVELVEKIKELGWMTALCTGSNWVVVEKELEELEMHLAFDVTTTGEEVMMSKPDPEIYLLTAQKLGVEPESCLVIEDAIAGVRAATEAGCKVIGLTSDYAPESILKNAGAEWVVSDVSQILPIVNNIVIQNGGE
ncbi:MAG: HAD hydrolase, family IA, variant 3 [Candidatus Amesbacteria bacterium GW2011_GWA1_44_24]|nr:MAG: HAD hydrolase, family IA, variant 3 [Candidatus Amesbacteria bacterium GW2011_GWA1_44_24]